MPIAIDGSRVPERLPEQNCGGTPWFDHGSGYAYRCDLCNAVIGSVGQPDDCKTTNFSTKELEK
tara:strand:- start:17382 stop:17573 length:192 start_codon:yes stop_codon:yes gene_type:complete